MKVLHWNISKKNQPPSGTKRYEDELFDTIRKNYPAVAIKRIQRLQNPVLGNTFLSWLYRYTRNDADIVHATFQTLAPVGYLKRPKKFVVTVLDLTPLVYPETRTDISTKIQWSLTPHALGIPDKIITISQFTKDELVRLWDYDEEKIEVIYLGVDHSRYHPMDRAGCKKRLGLDADTPCILTVASNLPHKRMDITREVFSRVRREDPRATLLKVGYGEELQGDHIVNLGWVDEEEMPYLYNAADVFLHTAEYEGFGLPVLEAMACGVPVVVSRSASLPEIVGDCGDLVDLSDPAHVANFASALLAILRGRRGRDGVERSRLFTWERTAEQTCRLYETLYQEQA